MKLRNWTVDSKSLFRIYITGSLSILMISLGVTALVLSLGFAAQEKQRSAITLDHISKSIEFQYRALAEEMWTQSYEAIAFRIREIAQQQNSPAYMLTLYDSTGTCVYRETNQGKDANCKAAAKDNRLLAKLISLQSAGAKIEAVETAQRYDLALPLMVGKTLKGFLACEFVDPYSIFRGNIASLLANYLLPALFGVFLLWLIWLYFSNKLLLKPYLSSMLESRKREALGVLATQVAHDIRSPLTALTMASRSLGENPVEKRALIEKAAFRINEIANDLLGQYRSQMPNHSQAANDSNPTPLNLKSVSIATVLEEIYQEKLVGSAHTDAFCLKLDLSGPVEAHCMIDQMQLTRVLSNLINNAIEAVSLKGEITIALRSSMKDVAIIISDDGKGIPQSVLEKLGTRPLTFGKSGDVVGSGLGFINAKVLVERMGGQIFIQSREGLGTIVTIRIPKIA